MGEIHSFHGKDVDGLSTSLSRSVGTSIMHCVVMEGKGAWLLTGEKSWSMDTILRQEPSINSTDASGMDVLVLMPALQASQTQDLTNATRRP